MAGLAIAGKYRQVWRSFGAPELIGIIKGVWMGVASSALVILYLPYRFEGFSRLVFAIDAVVARVPAGRGARGDHLDRRLPEAAARSRDARS